MKRLSRGNRPDRWSLVFFGCTREAEQKTERDERDHKRTSAERKERQRDAGHGDDVQYATDVQQHLHGKTRHEPRRKQRTARVARARETVGNHQPTHDDNAVERKHDRAAEQSPLFSEGSVHKVARHDGHVAHVAQFCAHAPPATAHDRRQSLESLPPHARRVRQRVTPHRKTRGEVSRRPREHERRAARQHRERGNSPKPRRREENRRARPGNLREKSEVPRHRHGKRHGDRLGTPQRRLYFLPDEGNDVCLFHRMTVANSSID